MGNIMRWTIGWIAPLLLVAGTVAYGQEAAAPADTAAAAEPPAAEQAAPPEPVFSSEQIEQMVAPIALYPDALIAQILMASTYPLEVVQATRWLGKHPDLEGEALDKAAAKEPWDPSVQALVFFPSVLQRMNDNLDWTQDLGDAVLAQQQDVLDSVQTLRQEAQEAGNLESTPQQRVETEKETIVIQPAEPTVVYVPSYNPTTVYAQPPPATNYYPAVNTAPPPATTTTVVQTESSSDNSNVLSFGAGALVGGLLTAAIMWDDDDHHDHYNDNIYYGGRGHYGGGGYWGKPNYWSGGYSRRPPVGMNRSNNDININTGDINIDNSRKSGKWEHNPSHRGGVKYQGKTTTQRYAKANKRTSVDTGRARGYDRRKGTTRQQPIKVSRDAPQRRSTSRTTTSARKSATAHKQTTPRVTRQSPKRDVSRPSQTARQQQRRAAPASRQAPRQQASRQAPRQQASRQTARKGSRHRSNDAFRVQGSAKREKAASSRGRTSRAAHQGGGRAERRGGGGGGGQGRIGRRG